MFFCHLKLRVAVTLAALAFSGYCTAASLAIGKICLQGVAETAVPGSETKADDGAWSEFTYAVEPQAPAGTPPMLVVFTKPAQTQRVDMSCPQRVVFEAARGNATILAGTLTALDLRVRHFVAVRGSNRLQINPNDLHATLTNVTSKPAPAHGGNVDLRGPTLTLTNAKQLFTDNTSASGRIDVAGTGLTITAARVLIAGGASASVTLSAKPADQQVFALDLAQARLFLLEGSLFGVPSTHLSGPKLDVRAAWLEMPDLVTTRAEVVAKRDDLSVSISGLKGAAARLVAGTQALNYDLTRPTLSVGTVSGRAAGNANGFAIDSPTIENLKSSASVAKSGNDAVTVLAGSTTLSIAKASKSFLQATSSWTQPQMPATEFLFPAGSIRKTQWNLSGNLNALSASGLVDSTQQQLGTVTTNYPTNVSLSRAQVKSELRIPIKIDAKAVKGSIAIADEDQAGVLTAGLNRFYLNGVLIIDLSDIKKSRAEFPPGGVKLGLEAMVATEAFVAGTKPFFGSLGITGENRTALVIGANRQGLFDVTVDTLTIGEPVIRIGQDGSTVKASLELNSVGKVVITSDIQDGDLILARGTFDAHDISFKLLEPGTWLDLDGTHVVDPMVTVKNLSINVDKTKAVEIGTALITDFKANASSVIKPVDPDHPSEVTYAGTLPERISVGELSAAHVSIDDVLAIDLLTLKTLKVHLEKANIDFGRGAHVSNASFVLSADSLQELKVNDLTTRILGNAHFTAVGSMNPGKDLAFNNDPDFSIDVTASGPTDRLTGDGTAHLDRFTGHQSSYVDVGFKCDNGDTLKAPFEYNFAVDGVDLAVQMRSGEFSGEGSIGPFGLVAHTKHRSSCNQTQDKFVIVAAHKAWTYGVCSKGLKVYKCRWKMDIPEVNFKWHLAADVEFAATTLIMKNPVVRVSDGHLLVCNRGAVGVPANLILLSISPQIDSNYPGALALVNAAFKVSFGLAESTALTGLANGLGWTFSAVATTGGNLKCLQ